jgi:hypothetical protein
LRNFGLKVVTVKFDARIKELIESLLDLTALVESLLLFGSWPQPSSMANQLQAVARSCHPVQRSLPSQKVTKQTPAVCLIFSEQVVGGPGLALACRCKRRRTHPCFEAQSQDV